MDLSILTLNLPFSTLLPDALFLICITIFFNYPTSKKQKQQFWKQKQLKLPRGGAFPIFMQYVGVKS